MPRLPTTPFPFLLAAALATAFMPGPTARAEIILAVVDPAHNGVIAYDNGGALASFGPASNDPARADAGNSHSALRQAGSQMRFSFEISTGTAATGGGNNDQQNALSAIAIAIEGTAGEAKGTPVTLTLSAGGANLPGPPSLSLIINSTSYPAIQGNTIGGLSVGDQFSFLGGLIADGSGNQYTLAGTLSVQQAAGPTPVPEPSGLMLMSAGLLPMLIVWRLGRGRGPGSQ
jgi:hypothetical protein